MLFYVLNYLIESSSVDVNVALVLISKELNLELHPKLWSKSCDIILSNLQRVYIDSAEIILYELLNNLQNLPLTLKTNDLVSNPLQNNPSNLNLYNDAQIGIKTLFRFLNEPIILPIYKIICIVQKYFKTINPAKSPHWILNPFIDIIFLHKQNLADFLIPYGRLDRCRIISKYKDDLVSQRKLPLKHQIIDDDTANIENERQSNTMWQRGVNTLLHLICEQVPIGTVLSTLLKTNFNVFCSSSNQSDNQQSQMLLEAVVLRVKQLVSFTEHKMNTLPNERLKSLSLEEIYDDWWGEWHRFGFQFYTFVEKEMIDFEGFVCRISQCKITDNGLIWLLSQCLMIERLKEYFMKDIIENNGWLTSTILSFRNKKHSEQAIAIRDTSVDCLIYRIRAIVANKKKSYEYLVNGIVPPSIHTRTSDLDKRREWWHSHRSNIDFYNPGDDQISVCLLSNFSSQPIAEQLYSFLKKPIQSNQPNQQILSLPGDIKFIGSTKPLSIRLLSCLSIKAHQRLIFQLENHIFKENQQQQQQQQQNPQQIQQVYAEPPGLIETYVRLLCMSPTPNRFKLQNNTRTAKECSLHILIEIINFRLMPLFRFNQATKWLIVDMHESLMNTKHHQLFNAIENLFIKASLYQTDISYFRATVSTIDFGITLNRFFLFSLARTIKVHGVSDFSSFSDKIPPLFKRLIQLTGANTWQSRQQWFPDKLKLLLNEEIEKLNNNNNNLYFSTTASIHIMPVSIDQVIQFCNSSSLSGMNIEAKYYLPIILSLKKSGRTTPNILNNTKISLSRLSPKDLSLVTYQFIDFVLDEWLQMNPKSKNNNQQQQQYIPEILQQNIINECGKWIDEMIWNNNLLSFDRVLLALADRDDDPNSYQLLEYFLITSRYITQYIHLFLQVEINPQTWEEPDFYSKMNRFFQQCNNPGPYKFGDQPLYPIYYGNIPLRFLPILDCLIMRFIETNNIDLLSKVLNSDSHRFLQLYRYHEAPVTFVKEIFHYYYESESLTPQTKATLSRIVYWNQDIKLSQELSNILHEILNSPDSFIQIQQKFRKAIETLVLLPLEKATRTSPPSTSNESLNVPFNTLREFGTVSDRILSKSVLELLLFPIELSKEIVSAILSPLENINNCINLRFSLLNAMGLLLASLPKTFSLQLLEISTGMLCSDSILIDFATLGLDGPLESPLSLHTFTEYSNSHENLLGNRSNCIITLLHSFFYHSTIEVFDLFPAVISCFTESNEPNDSKISYQNLFIVCRLLAPWVYRISKNSVLMDSVSKLFLQMNIYTNLIYFILFFSLNKIIVSLFNFLALVAIKEDQNMFILDCDITQTSLNPNSQNWLQDIIIDFLFHLNGFSPSTLIDPHQKLRVASVIDQLPTKTKSKFRYYFHK